MELLADGNGVNNGKDDEVHKDGHHLDDRHDHLQKGSERNTSTTMASTPIIQGEFAGHHSGERTASTD